MAGQGDTIVAVAEVLERNGWTVLFTCVPNTPHIGVVAIPIEGGSANQRYTDVIAYKGDVLRLTEVEVAMSDDVVSKTIERFGEQVKALSNDETWTAWSGRVRSLTGHALPEVCTLFCELVICKDLRPSNSLQIERVKAAAISVSDWAHYLP